MTRRDELVANILSHVDVQTKKDAQGRDWFVAKIRRQLDDELLYETKLIPVTEFAALGVDLYTDMIALALYDRQVAAEPTKVPRQRGASVRRAV